MEAALASRASAKENSVPRKKVPVKKAAKTVTRKAAPKAVSKLRAAKPTSAMKSYSVSKYCVYTIVEGEKLTNDFKKQKECCYDEGRPWVSAANLLEESRLTNSRMPVLFGDASNCGPLLYWGWLKDVQVQNGKTTKYKVERLQKIGGKPAPQVVQDLVRRKPRINIAPNFIRPYAICETPSFLLGEVQPLTAATLERFIMPDWMQNKDLARMFASDDPELQALADDPDAFPDDDEDGDDNAADGDACDEPEIEKWLEEELFGEEDEDDED
jgi:hypothetical protein